MIAKVAIDLALDRLFTYSVPEEMERKLAVGQLLLVPFGRRTARGFAMEICGGGADALPYTIKPILSIVDETPFFSGRILDLVRKIAAYTASPIESVLKAAVPAAVLRPGAKARELIYVEPAFSFGPVTVTKHQQWLYEQVVRLGGGWLQQLCRELKTTPSTIRTLGSKGLVAVKVRERRRDPLAGRRILSSKPLDLNPEQAEALSTILSSDRPVLLHGITGSGKTEVYLQAIASILASGRGAIVLVPEISLTPQTVQRFVSRFGDGVAVLHSALSDGERYDEWHRIRRGEARVVVGPRSAVFAPVADLGLIVVDEEHETGYKQDEMPRYHARDVAVLRGATEGAKVVLGSATPSLESWRNASIGKYALASMTRRAGSGTPPRSLVVDMSSTSSAGRIYSKELLDAIAVRLDRGEQTILFLNRRGWSRSVTCEKCGHVIECPDCSVPYTYHRADSCCRCHVCGGWAPVPDACPACGAHALAYRGVGTQRAEAALKACFAKARILRMDADSTSRKNSHDDILGAFRRHEADILLGTQMIAKGLDFPNVTLVGVLNADSSLNMPDFRAAERTFQLLAQVSGRAGRAGLPGDALIQTFDPSSPVIRAASNGDYAAFAAAELAERKAAFFPPYSHLACVNLRSEDPKVVSEWACMYARSLMKVPGLSVGEAVPSVLEKAEGRYRWQIVVRAEKAQTIARAWKWLSSARPAPHGLSVALDIDAYSLM
ncbi:MAG: primosomal protein N' [Kiritimatiellae bacterium]|nr:primosomal protein N' [Kiritimatiellia bacterium]